MAFNYTAFKAQWKAGCRKHGIDPATGPNSYQVALVKAEQVSAQHSPQERWWAEDSARAIWQAWPEPLELPPFAAVTVDRMGLLVEPIFQPASDTETMVIRKIGRDAAWAQGMAEVSEDDEVPMDMMTLIDLWQEVRRDLLDDLAPYQRSALPTGSLMGWLREEGYHVEADRLAVIEGG